MRNCNQFFLHEKCATFLKQFLLTRVPPVHLMFPTLDLRQDLRLQGQLRRLADAGVVRRRGVQILPNAAPSEPFPGSSDGGVIREWGGDSWNHPRDASVSRTPEVILPKRQLDSRPLERMRERANLRFKRRRRDDRWESPAQSSALSAQQLPQLPTTFRALNVRGDCPT